MEWGNFGIVSTTTIWPLKSGQTTLMCHDGRKPQMANNGWFQPPPNFFFFLFLDFFSKKKIIFNFFLKIYKYGIFVNSSSKNPCVTHLHHFLSKKTKIDNGWANLPTVEISKELITTF